MMQSADRHCHVTQCPSVAKGAAKPLRRQRSAGFSLIELLVSTLILGVALVACSQLCLTGMYTYQKARSISVATQRAQYEQEKLQNLPFNIIATALDADSCKLVPSLYPASTYQQITNNGQRGVAFTLGDVPDGHGTVMLSHFKGYQHILQIDITVWWQGTTPADTPVKITTLITSK